MNLFTDYTDRTHSHQEPVPAFPHPPPSALSIPSLLRAAADHIVLPEHSYPSICNPFMCTSLLPHHYCAHPYSTATWSFSKSIHDCHDEEKVRINADSSCTSKWRRPPPSLSLTYSLRSRLWRPTPEFLEEKRGHSLSSFYSSSTFVLPFSMRWHCDHDRQRRKRKRLKMMKGNAVNLGGLQRAKQPDIISCRYDDKLPIVVTNPVFPVC